MLICSIIYTGKKRVPFMQKAIIKECPGCGAQMSAREIIEKPEIKLLGMSFGPDNSPEMAYYFFQHEVENCQSSFLVPVIDMIDFIEEPIPKNILALSNSCERHCVNINDLRECRQSCYYASFRRFLIRMVQIKRRNLSLLDKVST